MEREEEIRQAAETLKGDKFWTVLAKCGFMDGAQWADAHPHWISIKDGFPDSLHVLVYDKREGVKMATLINRYNNDWECLNKDIFLLEVTHWMELPEEPSDLEN